MEKFKRGKNIDNVPAGDNADWLEDRGEKNGVVDVGNAISFEEIDIRIALLSLL